MKKLGFLPRDFNLREFLVKSTGQQIAGYYDDQTKTVSMLELGSSRPATDPGARTHSRPARIGTTICGSG